MELLQDIAQVLDAFLWPEHDTRQSSKRNRILAAATERFISQGYRKTSVEDVARDAGIAKGTVYLYYRNKSELLFHTVALEKRRYLTSLEPLCDPSLPPLDRLRSLVALSLVMSRRMPLLNRLTRGDREIELALQEVDVDLLDYFNRQQTALVAGLIDDATGHRWSAERLEQRARVLVDLIFAMATSGRMEAGGSALETHAQLIAEVVVTGAVHDAGGPPEWPKGAVDAMRAVTGVAV